MIQKTNNNMSRIADKHSTVLVLNCDSAHLFLRSRKMDTIKTGTTIRAIATGAKAVIKRIDNYYSDLAKQIHVSDLDNIVIDFDGSENIIRRLELTKHIEIGVFEIVEE